MSDQSDRNDTYTALEWDSTASRPHLSCFDVGPRAKVPTKKDTASWRTRRLSWVELRCGGEIRAYKRGSVERASVPEGASEVEHFVCDITPSQFRLYLPKGAKLVTVVYGQSQDYTYQRVLAGYDGPCRIDWNRQRDKRWFVHSYQRDWRNRVWYALLSDGRTVYLDTFIEKCIVASGAPVQQSFKAIERARQEKDERMVASSIVRDAKNAHKDGLREWTESMQAAAKTGNAETLVSCGRVYALYANKPWWHLIDNAPGGMRKVVSDAMDKAGMSVGVADRKNRRALRGAHSRITAMVCEAKT